MDRISALEQRISQLEASVSNLEDCNRGNVTAFMRMKAQNSAAHSLLFEVTEMHGLPTDVISEHFRVRTAYYLDRLLCDAEKASPQLGAVLDDREEEEVPEFNGYPPLFTGNDPDEGLRGAGE